MTAQMAGTFLPGRVPKLVEPKTRRLYVGDYRGTDQGKKEFRRGERREKSNGSLEDA